eukprot:1031012-Prymnesium_polylepis.1
MEKPAGWWTLHPTYSLTKSRPVATRYGSQPPFTAFRLRQGSIVFSGWRRCAVGGHHSWTGYALGGCCMGCVRAEAKQKPDGGCVLSSCCCTGCMGCVSCRPRFAWRVL